MTLQGAQEPLLHTDQPFHTRHPICQVIVEGLPGNAVTPDPPASYYCLHDLPRLPTPRSEPDALEHGVLPSEVPTGHLPLVLTSSLKPMCIPQSSMTFLPAMDTRMQLRPTSWPAPEKEDEIRCCHPHVPFSTAASDCPSPKIKALLPASYLYWALWGPGPAEPSVCWTNQTSMAATQMMCEGRSIATATRTHRPGKCAGQGQRLPSKF